MEIYRVTFVGQGVIGDEEALKAVLVRHITRLLRENEFVEFSVSRENHFDAIATAAVRCAQKLHGAHNSMLILSLPHRLEKEDDFAQTYDDIIYSIPMGGDESRTVQNNRRVMIERSRLVLGLAHEASGEAYQALEYAKGRGKAIQNLADEVPDGEPELLPLGQSPISYILR